MSVLRSLFFYRHLSLSIFFLVFSFTINMLGRIHTRKISKLHQKIVFSPRFFRVFRGSKSKIKMQKFFSKLVCVAILGEKIVAKTRFFDGKMKDLLHGSTYLLIDKKYTKKKILRLRRLYERTHVSTTT